MKLSILVLTILSIWTFRTFGQTKYIQTNEGSIVDSTTYAKMKAEKVEKMKNIFPTMDSKVVIKDNFKEIRRTKDSLIYAYNWHIKIGDSKIKDNKSFDPEDYIDKEFPLLSLKTLDNKVVSISHLKGKPTLINFWFTTCKPCIEEMPILNAIKSKLKDSVNFVAITFEPTDKVVGFLKKHKFGFTQIANAKKFTDSIKMNNFPINIILDKNGIVIDIKNGIPYILDNKEQLKMSDGNEFIAALRKLL